MTKVLTQAEKYDCSCGEWSEHLVIQNPTTAATEFCTRMARLSMKFFSGPWATLVKVGAGCGLWRSSLFIYLFIYYGNASKFPRRRQFPLGRSGRMVLDPPEKISMPIQSISPVFSITYLRKMPQFAA